ncbi:amidohydrolase 3 [Moniliophthora roreri MCA 2997]|uniref:Amidohydrolase 3 n=2 Tax=Moniliophthora roreri TaxID=221103 RepID=V2XN12_MONRO|nr:amidohydrolase 3 [Moniliophthora roreri MCA 2997]KAI3608792.1 amidohydrolase 3 [Moniliophthora roreri]
MEKDAKPPNVPRPKRRSLNRLWVSALLLGFGALRSLHTNTSEQYILCSNSQNIYTVDAGKPRVQCFAVRGSTIVETGGLDELKEAVNPLSSLPWLPRFLQVAPRVIHVDSSSIVVPGLADAHAHIIENGFKMQLQLDTAKSISEVIERIKAYIIAHPDLPSDRWIEGMGWDQNKWPESKFPTAADLDTDPLLRGKAIALRRVDGHATWVSSRVLETMGEIPPDSEVEGGLIIRDESGKPTGVFVDNAISLIPIPEWSEDQIEEYFNVTMKEALKYGLTSIHDADTYPQIRKFFIKQAEAGKIPMRLYLMLNGHSEVPEKGLLIKHGKGSRLTIRSIKMYTDGALGSWGAALLEPYSDKPDTSGIMRNTQGEMDRLVRKYWKNGWQVNIHCIGDRANHVVLNIFEDIIQGETKANVSEWRPRIEHAQIMTKEDLVRAGTLGVITSVQPTHATSDMWYAETRLGPERIKGAYAYQTQLKNSQRSVLPLGSDFPVEGVNPLLGFYASVSRLAVDGTSPHGSGGWHPEERLTREQALKAMTLDPAYASFTESELGSLEKGKKADFVVLDRDIMTVPFEEILQAKVKATVVDGKVVYGSLD